MCTHTHRKQNTKRHPKNSHYHHILQKLADHHDHTNFKKTFVPCLYSLPPMHASPDRKLSTAVRKKKYHGPDPNLIKRSRHLAARWLLNESFDEDAAR